MVIFMVLVGVVRSILTSVFVGIYSNTEAIGTIFAIAVFLALALYFVKATRAYAIPAFVIMVIVYAGLAEMQPHLGSIVTVLSFVIALVATIVVKRQEIRWIRRNSTIPRWLKNILYVL